MSWFDQGGLILLGLTYAYITLLCSVTDNDSIFINFSWVYNRRFYSWSDRWRSWWGHVINKTSRTESFAQKKIPGRLKTSHYDLIWADLWLLVTLNYVPLSTNHAEIFVLLFIMSVLGLTSICFWQFVLSYIKSHLVHHFLNPGIKSSFYAVGTSNTRRPNQPSAAEWWP